MKTITLNNGVEMPQIGYGVYQVSPAECERCVSDALRIGYRMIDTAQAYHNETEVGNAIRKSGIDRNAIFLVSKIWISNYGYEKARQEMTGERGGYGYGERRIPPYYPEYPMGMRGGDDYDDMGERRRRRSNGQYY